MEMKPVVRYIVLASVDEDVGGAGRHGVVQEDGGVAPPVPVPRLGRIGAYLHAERDKQTTSITLSIVRSFAYLAIDTEMEAEGTHTGQLTRGMPSLVPVPRKMSSDCVCFSCSVADAETALPGDARAPQEREEKERAGRNKHRLFTRRHYVEQMGREQ